MEQELYRVTDFCERYALSARSFYREVTANRLKIIKRGRRTYVAREDAELWLQKLRHPQPSAGAATAQDNGQK